jgi:hypothetical protein
MAIGIGLAVLVAAASTSAKATATPASAGFTLCRSTFALCTSAPCTPIAGQKGKLACRCRVQTGYSAATKACQTPQETSTVKLMSRYYPLKSYAVCSNNRPWAWCLNAPCAIDKKDPSKATCTCKPDSGSPYAIVTKTVSKTTCTTGIISSATVQDIDQISDFLKIQKLLQPFPIKVLNGPSQ